MHSSGAIVWGCLFSPLMAPCGQRAAQSVQPLHASGSMEKVISALQTAAGQRLSSTWARYSSRKWRSVESTGLTALVPRAHSEVALTVSASSSMRAMVSRVPRPSAMSPRRSRRRQSPSRHDVQFPHDSEARKRRK